MSNSDSVLLLDKGVSGSLVVEVEGKDSMLVGNLESGRVHSTGGGDVCLVKSETVVRIQHCELDLNVIGDEGDPSVLGTVPLGQTNGVCDFLVDLVDFLVENIRGGSQVVLDELGRDDILGKGHPLKDVSHKLSVALRLGVHLV